MICFHHNDADGYCAGAIVKLKYPECMLIPIDYKDEFPIHSISDDEEVWIVDFSLQNWDDLLKRTKNVIWIDHHKTAIEKFNHLNLKGVRLEGHPAGCELTWKFIFIDKEIPKAVNYISLYDTWKHKDDPDILNFIEGLNNLNMNSDTLWYALLNEGDDLIEEIIEEGEKLADTIKNKNKKLLAQIGFVSHFQGLKILCANIAKVNSKFFESAPNEYDALVPFYFDGFQFIVSLYGPDDNTKDLSVIAKELGGGGHPGACGFQCEKLPFVGMEKYNG